MFFRTRKIRYALVFLVAIAAISATAVARSWNEYYGAVAVGFWSGGVASGAAWNHASQREADNEAMKGCNKGGYNCAVQYRFWNGHCGYVSIANDSGNCAGWADTANGAYNACVSRGCSCKSARGGCTSAPD